MPNTKIASFFIFIFIFNAVIANQASTRFTNTWRSSHAKRLMKKMLLSLQRGTYMEVYYPSLLWCGEQRQGEGLVIATHWLLVPSTSHFTDYCKIKKEKLTGKTRKGVYKVRAPPPSQFDMLRLLFPLVDPLSLIVPLTLGWVPNSLHFSYTTWSSRFHTWNDTRILWVVCVFFYLFFYF